MFTLSETTLEKTAKLLTQEYDIQVVFSMNTPVGVSGRTITLPPVTPDTPQDMVDAIQGYLDHQAAMLLFSNVTRFDIAKSKNREEFATVLNMVEGLRVERVLSSIYPGTENNFRNAYALVLGNLLKNWDNVSFFDKVITGSLLQLQYQDSNAYRNLTEDVLDWAKAVEKLWNEVDPRNIEDSIELTEEIMNLFSLPEPPPPPPAGGGSSDEENEDESEESEDPGDSGGSSDSESGESEQEESQSNQVAANGTSSPLSSKSLDGDPFELTVGDLQKSLGDCTSKKPVDATDNAVFYDYVHDALSDDSYLIYSTEYDIIVNLNKKVQEGTFHQLSESTSFSLAVNDIAKTQALRDTTRPYTSVLKTKLINILRTKTRRKWVGGKTEGRLDSRRLSQAVVSNAENIYKNRTDKFALDTVIVLAVDHSGSMHQNSRIEIAMKSVLTIADALHALKIPFMIYGFSTKEPTTAMRIDRKTAEVYGRYNRRWLGIYQDFNDSWAAGARAVTIGASGLCIQENALDGESILWGAKQLMSRPEKRKILMVFSDGYPEPGYGNRGRNQKYLTRVSSMIQKSPIELITFGIQTDSVKHYYKDYTVINNLSDLVSKPFEKIANCLLKEVK